MLLVARATTSSPTFRITATNPPTIVPGWSVDRSGGLGCGSPFVTSTDGTNNMIVWVVGTPEVAARVTSDYMVTTEIPATLFMPVAARTN